MVESNFQRSEILPSEKAYAYKMRLGAMKKQGKRTDLTSGPVGQKLNFIDSPAELAETVEDSARKIRRYIRLTKLVPELLEFVDEGKTKGSKRDIRVLDKSANLSAKMKNGLARIKDQANNLSDDGQVSLFEYAEDNIRYSAENVSHDSVYFAK